MGFAHHTHTVVAIVPLPVLKENSTFNRYKLVCLNGTRTGSLDIVNLEVSIDSVLSHTPSGNPTRKTGSRYINPELGIAERALEIAESIIIKNGSNPRLAEAPAALISLRKQIAEIDVTSANKENDTVHTCYRRDDLIHRCIRFLTIVEGGFALSADSMSSLLWSQVRLLDVFIQPQALIQLKLSKISESH